MHVPVDSDTITATEDSKEHIDKKPFICNLCKVLFPEEDSLLTHILDHVTQPSILIHRLQLAPIKLTFKSRSDNQFEIVHSPNKSHQSSPEYYTNDQMETDVAADDTPTLNGESRENNSHFEEINTDIMGLQEVTTVAFSPTYLSAEEQKSPENIEPSKSVSPKMTSDQFTGDIPGAEPTPPPESPTEYPKIRIKTTGLLKESLTITEITDDNPDGEYRPSELVDISNSGENNSDISNFWSTPCLEDPLKLPENEHNDSILSSFLNNNTDHNKDFNMSTDNEFISLERLDDRNRKTMQLYNPRNAAASSSNPLNSLSGLPMQQLAEQVSRLQPSGSGMHQQNVLINIQQFPQPPQPPSYQHPPMYSSHPGMPGQPPHMYQPYQYQHPPNPMYFPPGPNYPPGPHMQPPQMQQPSQQMQQSMPPPQPQYRQSMPQRMSTAPQQFNQTPQRGPTPRQQAPTRPQMGPRQPMGPRQQMIQRLSNGQRQPMAAPRQGMPMRQRAPAPMIRPKTGMVNAVIRGPRPRMQNSNIMTNGVQNNQQGMQRLKRVNEQIQNQIKKKRMDVLVPDKNDDPDCQVIAMQPKNTDGGLPQITNVQGGTTDLSDNVMHLSDSITLSVRNPQPRPSSPKKSDAKQVANILATRGITVTATPKPKEKTSSNEGSPSTSASTSPIPTVAINLNNAVSIIPTAKNGAQANAKPTDSRLPTVDLTDDSASDTQQNVQQKQQQMPQQKNNQPRGALPFKCDLCPAQYPTMAGLNKHRQSFHKTASPCEIGIPLIDFKQPGIMQKLTSIGIYNFIPLPNSTNGNFALPVISLNAAKNSSLCNLATLGASSILSLGPVRSLPKNQSNNMKQQQQQQPPQQ